MSAIAKLTVRWGETSYPTPGGHPDTIRWRAQALIEDVVGAVHYRMTIPQFVLFRDEEDGGVYRDQVFSEVRRASRDEDSRLNVTDWSISSSLFFDEALVTFFPKSWSTDSDD